MPYIPAVPIEYAFYQMIVALQAHLFFLNNLWELINAVQNMVTNLNGFDALFNNFGY